ncbi:MAG: AarF/ABC1/UbiB kinase family protein, partial [Verrucomicrobiae bacterium]|nr:AarF/ABC1/UbiB kinase family protein [Verrucomicrobiae bacterium]
MAATIDRLRFVRVSWFFLRAFIAVAIRDVLCDRPGLRWLKGDPDRRWHAWALEFRALALRLGGVLIKLGQFLSTRVDILPLTITEPLADLQDEVPAAPFGDVVAGIERELGAPISSVFEHLEERPLGAASLAQAHAAVLPGGERVVLKVLRPGIERIVETDLAAIGRGILWLGVFQAVRRRVDLGRLGEEFARVTRLELDLQHEGQNAELFAAAFAEDDGVIVPRVEWRWSRRRLLALQDVGAIRSADTAALVAAGIDPGEVAREINRLFLEQVFVHHLVHCDPHPGNLFIHPVRDGSARTFRVALVDFGMVVEVP